MTKIQISTPKGVRDFSPLEVRQRRTLLDTLRKHFERFAFLPLETGAMENLSVLQGKYGDEGDRLLFRILNSGDFLKDVSGDPRELSRPELTNAMCEKGLRYDLTVPFARYVAMHWHELSHPFKRYQMQPVWRADRPQKGRYREFMQCDVDVVGTTSTTAELELLDLVLTVFTELKLPVEVQLNSRRILEAFASQMGHPELLVPMTVTLDKLDKVGMEAVRTELLEMGFASEDLDVLLHICSQTSLFDTVKACQPWLVQEKEKDMSFTQELGDLLLLLEELQQLQASHAGVQLTPLAHMLDGDASVADDELWTDGHIVRFAPALARGLSYYTGAIFEVKIRGAQMGSVCGGGRYDNLTGIFGLEGVSGVGISFGIDRICDVMKERGLLPTEETGIDILLVHDSYNELSRLMAIAHQLRSADFNTLVLPDPMLLKKHMEYANKHHIPFVGWIYENTRLKLRNMRTGEEHEAIPQETIAWLSAQQQN